MEDLLYECDVEILRRIANDSLDISIPYAQPEGSWLEEGTVLAYFEFTEACADFADQIGADKIQVPTAAVGEETWRVNFLSNGQIIASVDFILKIFPTWANIKAIQNNLDNEMSF